MKIVPRALIAAVGLLGGAGAYAQAPARSATDFAHAPALSLERLPDGVNTDAYDEISPVVSRDGRQLYFTRSGSPDFNTQLLFNGTDARDSIRDNVHYEQLLRDVYRQIGERGGGEAYTSRFNQDVWQAELARDGSVLAVTHPDTPLNNALPNALAAALPDPAHYVVLNQFPRRGGMAKGFSHVYARADGSWSWPEPLTIDDYGTRSDGVGMTLSADGEVMILSLERGGGRGATDLYLSRRLGPTHWSAPVNLGPGINTPSRESTPSLSEDKRTLYFSSNRRGRGGNDIYFCRRLDDSWQNWSPARRFKPPISSEHDDSQPYFNEATGYLYFASNRAGSSDVYRVRVQPPRPVDLLVVGRVRHARTREPLEADVVVKGRGYGGLDTVLATSGGRFALHVDHYAELSLSAEKEGFLGHVERLSLRRGGEATSYEIDIYLDPREAGGTITLAPIYFQQSKADVKVRSEPELARLRDLLAKYPNVYVRIEGHTDDRGPVDALDKLSRERAQAIRDYLVANGIDPRRVQAAGLGPRKPVASNDTTQGREANRRVEVVITRVLGGAGKPTDPALRGSAEQPTGPTGR